MKEGMFLCTMLSIMDDNIVFIIEIFRIRVSGGRILAVDGFWHIYSICLVHLYIYIKIVFAQFISIALD